MGHYDYEENHEIEGARFRKTLLKFLERSDDSLGWACKNIEHHRAIFSNIALTENQRHYVSDISRVLDDMMGKTY